MFTGARTPPRLITLILLVGLSVMSLNMFLPSLPNIAAEFKAGYTLVTLSIAGYARLTAVPQLIPGPLSDRYGRRPVLLSGRYAGRFGLVAMIMTGRLVACCGLTAGLAPVMAGIVDIALFFAATACVGIGNGLTRPTQARASYRSGWNWRSVHRVSPAR